MENYHKIKEALSNQILGNEEKEEDLLKRFNISFLEFNGIIYELKQEGYNIQKYVEEDEELKTTWYKNWGHSKLGDPMNYKIIDNDDEIRIMLISDTRLGSIYQQLSIINQCYELAHEMGVKYVFHNGDISEGEYRGEYAEWNDKLLFCRGLDEQTKYIANNYPYVKGMNTYFITGDHDRTHYTKKRPLDIGKMIADKREDMIYLGPKSKEITFVNENSLNDIKLFMTHPKGAVPYTVSYRPQQYIYSMRGEDDIDILSMGHLLNCDSFDERGIFEFQVPSLCATTPEMKEAKLANDMGAWILIIKKNRFGKIASIRPRIMPFYNSLEEDYKRSKVLKLGGIK